MAAEGRYSQAGTTDARNCVQGGRNTSAHSNRRDSSLRAYDPLLGRHTIPTVKASDLLEQIVNDANFLTALKAIKSDPNKTAGCDHKTIPEVCNPLIESPVLRNNIRTLILHGKYHPEMVRTTQIPKANGKLRTLGIATVQDRVVQKMILQAITNNFAENTWSKYSYAYQPHRSVADAITEVDRIREEGYQYAISLDLKAFFDNVPHDRLLAKLRRHVSDDRAVKLITKFITPVMLRRKERPVINRVGTPQGSVISPWLASMLYLDELDKELTLRGLRFVRYADDVTVFCRSISAAKRVKANLMDFIESTMKCPVNRGKTKVIPIKRLELLGVFLKGGKWHIQRKKSSGACAQFLKGLFKYRETGDVYYLRETADQMQGFLNHYGRIPDIASKEAKQLKRWCQRKLRSIVGTVPYWCYNLFLKR